MRISVFTVLLLVLSIGCGQSINNVYTVAPLKVYLYGDSISSGYGDPTYSQLYAINSGQALVSKSYGGTSMYDKNSNMDPAQYTVISGETWGVNDTVMWSPGINDAVLHGADRHYMNLYKHGLRHLLRKLKSSGAKLIIGTPNHNCNETRFGRNSVIDQYAAINKREFDRVLGNYGKAKFVDFTTKFVPTTTNTLDCIHPNALGYQQMYSILIN